MKDLLEEYGERWRASQAAPPVVAAGAFRDRPRWPVIAVAVAVVLGGGGAALGVLRGGVSSSKPAQLRPGTVPTSAPPLPRHAGTAADPVPWLDRAPGPADIPALANSDNLVALSNRCPRPVTGSLAVAVSGFELRLATPATCRLAGSLTVRLEAADGSVVTVTSAAADREATYPTVTFGGPLPALAAVTLPCGFHPVRAVVDGTITVPVAGSSAACAASASATPLGAGYVPAVVPAGRSGLEESLALPQTAPVGGGSVAGLLTLINPTATAIPLNPCTAVGGSVVGKIHGVGSEFFGDLSFGLNCAQAPAAVPADGRAVFAVVIPTREGELGPITVTLAIPGIASAQPATVVVEDPTKRSPGTAADPVPWQDLAVGPDDIPGPEFGSGGGAAAACNGNYFATLTMHVDGSRMLGLLQVSNAGNACAIGPFLSISLTTPDGRPIAATAKDADERLSRTTGYQPVSLGGADLGNGFASVTSPLLCATGAVTAHIADDRGQTVTAAVTGIPATGCASSRQQVLTASPLGLGRAPAVPAIGYDQLRVALAIPARTTGRVVDAKLTLRNPTAAPIALGSPCSAVTGFDSYPIGGMKQDRLGFALNCGQAPDIVPALGSVVFDVHLSPVGAPAVGPVSFTVSVAGIPGTATGSTRLG